MTVNTQQQNQLYIGLRIVQNTGANDGEPQQIYTGLLRANMVDWQQLTEDQFTAALQILSTANNHVIQARRWFDDDSQLINIDFFAAFKGYQNLHSARTPFAQQFANFVRGVEQLLTNAQAFDNDDCDLHGLTFDDVDELPF